jgi:hypothetical protein
MPQRMHTHLNFSIIRIILIVFVFGGAFLLVSREPARAISSTIVISEFRTRGPGGAADDFIELFNRSDENINIGGWQVRALQTRSTNSATVTIFNGVVLYPGSNYLIGGPGYSGAVTPDQGFAGMPDNVGIGLLTPNGAVVDAVATDFSLYEEGGPLVTIVTNEDRGYQRKPLGSTRNVIDTDHNSDDFRLVSPSRPESLAISLISGLGVANPSAVGQGDPTLLTVEVTPGQFPSSTGLSVTGDLSPIGGLTTQVFYDDATHGDKTASDNVFSFQTQVSASSELGGKNITVHITDLQDRNAAVFIGLDIQISPAIQCDQERLSVRVGTDKDADLIDLGSLMPTTIAVLYSLPKPNSIPDNNRISPYETTVWVINATLRFYKLDAHLEYQLNLRDELGNTILAMIPCSCCIASSSVFGPPIAKARSEFDKRFTALDTWQAADVPVRITGVGFFESLHGQTDTPPNGAELYPVLDIKFDVDLKRPEIIDASVNGKHLWVNGLNFDDGAKVFMNGEKQKTANDEGLRTTRLIAKKTGKKIARGETVTLQVRNADDSVSTDFSFKRPE